MFFKGKKKVAASSSSAQVQLTAFPKINFQQLHYAERNKTIRELFDKIKRNHEAFSCLEKTASEINQHIQAFNQNTGSRKDCLDKITKCLEGFDSQFPSYFYPALPKFGKYREVLKQELINAYQKLGFNGDGTDQESKSMMAELLKNMKPKHVNRLVSELHKSAGICKQGQREVQISKAKLISIYNKKSSDPLSKGFIEFLNQHKIYLLHHGNSIAYLIESEVTGDKEVLKLDSFLLQPQKNFIELRQNEVLAPYFVDLKASRRASGHFNYCCDYNNGRYEKLPVMVNIFLTDYFPSGSLEQLAVQYNHPARYTSRVLAATMKIFVEIADFLSKLESQHLLMSDLKLTNILCSYSKEKEGWKISIIDTKSIVPVNENYVYSNQIEECEGFIIIYSEEYFPNWATKGIGNYIDGKALHSYLLAMNFIFFWAHRKSPPRLEHRVFSDGQKGYLLTECMESLMNKYLLFRIDVQQAAEFFTWFTDEKNEEYVLKRHYMYLLRYVSFKERFILVDNLYNSLVEFENIIIKISDEKLVATHQQAREDIFEKLEELKQPKEIKILINKQLTALITSMRCHKASSEGPQPAGFFKPEPRAVACSSTSTSSCKY